MSLALNEHFLSTKEGRAGDPSQKQRGQGLGADLSSGVHPWQHDLHHLTTLPHKGRDLGLGTGLGQWQAGGPAGSTHCTAVEGLSAFLPLQRNCLS